MEYLDRSMKATSSVDIAQKLWHSLFINLSKFDKNLIKRENGIKLEIWRKNPAGTLSLVCWINNSFDTNAVFIKENGVVIKLASTNSDLMNDIINKVKERKLV